MDNTLTGTTILGQIGPRSNGNEWGTSYSSEPQKSSLVTECSLISYSGVSNIKGTALQCISDIFTYQKSIEISWGIYLVQYSIYVILVRGWWMYSIQYVNNLAFFQKIQIL